MNATANTQTNRKNSNLFNNLYNENKGLIKSIVSKYARIINDRSRQYYAIEVSDIESEANIAFYKAVSSFDPKKEAKFSTYAYFLMDCAIKNLLNRQVNRNNYIPEAHKEDNNGSFRILSLSAECGDDMTIEEIIADEETDVFEHVDKKIKKESVEQYLSTLDDKESELIKALYGFDGKEQSGEELAFEMNMTRAGIKYHKDKILLKLASNRRKVERIALRA